MSQPRVLLTFPVIFALLVLVACGGGGGGGGSNPIPLLRGTGSSPASTSGCSNLRLSSRRAPRMSARYGTQRGSAARRSQAIEFRAARPSVSRPRPGSGSSALPSRRARSSARMRPSDHLAHAITNSRWQSTPPVTVEIDAGGREHSFSASSHTGTSSWQTDESGMVGSTTAPDSQRSFGTLSARRSERFGPRHDASPVGPASRAIGTWRHRLNAALPRGGGR